MERFVKGDIVILSFPFSDLSSSKKRPALVLADIEGDDILLCQITSQQRKDSNAVFLNKNELQNGFLPSDSYIRPLRIFAADKSIIIRKAGNINRDTLMKVVHKIIDVIQ